MRFENTVGVQASECESLGASLLTGPVNTHREPSGVVGMYTSVPENETFVCTRV